MRGHPAYTGALCRGADALSAHGIYVHHVISVQLSVQVTAVTRLGEHRKVLQHIEAMDLKALKPQDRPHLGVLANGPTLTQSLRGHVSKGASDDVACLLSCRGRGQMKGASKAKVSNARPPILSQENVVGGQVAVDERRLRYLLSPIHLLIIAVTNVHILTTALSPATNPSSLFLFSLLLPAFPV